MTWSMLLVALQLASQTLDAGSTPPCDVMAIEAHPLSEYLDSRARTGLTAARRQLCEDIRAKKANLATVDAVLVAITYRFAACRGSSVNPDYQMAIQEQAVGSSLVVVVRKFCQDTLRPSQQGTVDGRVLLDRVAWLHGESFCVVSAYIVDPGGWRALVKSDLPSVVRLRGQAESLCTQVRDGKLTSDQAWHRFDLEVVRAREHLPPEAARQAVGAFTNAVNALRNLFGK